MSWTDEKVNKLKELWGKGNTASQIAEIIGGISRNAVIGKAHRLNLSAKIKTRAATSNQSYENSIIDKINTFFGYNYIENVELKLLHTRREKNSNDQSQFDFKKFDKDLEQIKDLKLKRKLNELIKAYNEKNN